MCSVLVSLGAKALSFATKIAGKFLPYLEQSALGELGYLGSDEIFRATDSQLLIPQRKKTPVDKT